MHLNKQKIESFQKEFLDTKKSELSLRISNTGLKYLQY